MTKIIQDILHLCSDILSHARLITAYDGHTQQFYFPQDENWYVDPRNNAVSIHYTADVFQAGLFKFSIPDQSDMYSKLMKRISASKVNRYQFDYLLRAEQKLIQLRENYNYLREAHQSVVESLGEVNRFISSGTKSFMVHKLSALKGLKLCMEQFDKNPILNGSHCEQALIKINHLILLTTNPPALDRDAALYCLTMNIILDKINTLVRSYQPMGIEAFNHPTIRGIVRHYPFLGFPYSLVKQQTETFNQILKEQFDHKQNEFTTLMTSLMVCYSDALMFPDNLIKYIAGDSTAINFEAVIAKNKLDLSKTNILVGNLAEGELYHQLDLASGF